MLQDRVTAIKVFIMYAHKDEKLRSALVEHLAALEHQGVIKIWCDRDIIGGGEWETEIDQRIESANIVLLLVSPAFIASKYITGVELERALARHAAGEARVIPIILRPCLWRNLPFGKLQALPRNGKAVDSWRNRDEAFLDVARGIETAVYEMKETFNTSIITVKGSPRQAVAGVSSKISAGVAIRNDEAFTEPLTGEVFLPVPAGSFQMGSETSFTEKPIHRVNLSGFWLARTPVTNRQYQHFLETRAHTELDFCKDHQFSEPDQPMVDVSWEEAMAYCYWLTEMSPVGGKFCLPTEAQWEYAARGTDGRQYPWGDEVPNKYLACFNQDYELGPAKVGSYPHGAGPFGHFDLAGNVWEWCMDSLEMNYQRWAGAEPLDPVGEADTNFRSLRGGGWKALAIGLQSTSRSWREPGYSFNDIGFRLAWSPSSADL